MLQLRNHYRKVLVSNRKERVQFINYLNIIACFAVICLHCSQLCFRPENSASWYYSVFMQSAFVFAVPIFFMISGANLLAYDQRYSTATFFKKRFKRTFGALLIGSSIVYILTCICPNAFSRAPRVFSLIDFLDLFMTNQIELIYWFFYIVLAIYLFTPILSHLASSKSKLGYAIIFFFSVSTLIPTISRYIPSFEYIQSLFGTQSLTGGIAFYLIGYYVCNYLTPPKKKACFGIFLSCVALMFFTTIAINVDAIKQPNIPYDGFYTNAFSVFSFLGSTALFVLFKSLEPQLEKTPNKIKSIVEKLSSASLGVYLIHLLVMDFIATIAPHPWWISMTIEPVPVYIISVAIVLTTQFLTHLLKSTRKVKR